MATRLVTLPDEILTLIFSYFLPGSNAYYNLDFSMWEQIGKYIMPLLHTCSTFRRVIREENHELWKNCFVDLRWDYLDGSIYHKNVNNIFDEDGFRKYYDEMMELIGVAMGESKLVKKLTMIQFPKSYKEGGEDKSWLRRVLNDFRNVEQLVWMDSAFLNDEISTSCLKFEKLKTLSIYTNCLNNVASLVLDNEITDLSLSLSSALEQELPALKDKDFEKFELTNQFSYENIRENPSIFNRVSFLNSIEIVPIELFSHIYSLHLECDSISFDSSFSSGVLVGLDLNCKNVEFSGAKLPKLESLELDSVEAFSYQNTDLSLKSIRLCNTDPKLIDCIPTVGIVGVSFRNIQSLKMEANKWSSVNSLNISNVSNLEIDLNKLKTLYMNSTFIGHVKINHVEELQLYSSSAIHINRVDKVSLNDFDLEILEHLYYVKNLECRPKNLSRDSWKYLSINKIENIDISIGHRYDAVSMSISDIKSVSYEDCFFDDEKPKINKYTTVFNEVLPSDLEIETISNFKVRSKNPFCFPNQLDVIPLFNKLTYLDLFKTKVDIDLSSLPHLSDLTLSQIKEQSRLSLSKPHNSLKFINIDTATKTHINFVIDCAKLREVVLLNLDLQLDSKIEIVNAPKLLTFHIDQKDEYLQKGQFKDYRPLNSQ